MKKTTYWVIGMFIACFLSVIVFMLYDKYSDSDILDKPLATTSIPIGDIRVIEVQGQPRSSRLFNITVCPYKATNRVTYPAGYIQVVQKGDTLKIVGIDNNDSRKSVRSEGRIPTVTIATHSVKEELSLLLNGNIFNVRLAGLKAKKCSILGNQTNRIVVQKCLFDKFCVTSGCNLLELSETRVKSMTLQVNNLSIKDNSTWHVDSLYLRGNNDNISPVMLNSQQMGHVYLQPAKGKTITTTCSANSEIQMKK